MNSRLDSFDAVKLFAIVLVIYGHCVQHLLLGNELENYAYLIIYSFHMPLFMIVSGFFSHSSMDLSLPQFLKKKSIQLLLPTAIWGGAIVIIRYLFREENSLPQIIRDDLWFLKSLFMCYVLTYIFMIVKNPYRIILIIATILVTQVSVFRMKEMYPCFLFGFLLRDHYDEFLKHKRLIMTLSILVYLILGWIFINPSFFDVNRCVFGYMIKESSILAIGLSASLFVILSFSTLCSHNNRFRLIAKIGKYTLCTYLVQSIIVETISPHYFNFASTNMFNVYVLYIPLIVVAIVAISIFVEKMLDMSKLTRLIFLGKYDQVKRNGEYTEII